MTFTARLRHAVTGGFHKPPEPPAREGELAFADPRRLFPGGYSMPYNPSHLASRRGLRVFDEMRRDDQVKAALAFKKHAILTTGWTVTSPEGQPDEWEPTMFVRWVLNNLDPGEVGGGTLDNDLYEILSGLDYGFSLTEKIWAPIEDGEWAGHLGLRSLKTRAPHYFWFEQDQFGNLLPDGVIQMTNSMVKAGKLPREKFVLYTYQPSFSNPYGTSDLEAAYRPYWAKDNTFKWLAMLLERLGIPPVFGLYNPTRYTPSQIDDLKQIITNLQAATFGIIPRPAKDDLEFWAPELAGQATRVFVPSIELFDKAIARAILMPGLLGMSPDSAQGSFARAKVNFDVFLLVIEAIRRDVEQVLIMNQVVRPLVDLNYPGIVDYPQWRFLPLTDDLRLQMLDSWINLVGAGVVTNQPEDEAHARAMLKFPDKQTPVAPAQPDPSQEAAV
ncbi:MAG TPA: DUF935 family protein [Methylomirabilota bacterium]|jgi:phage gp29-like protein|nr:DUF935 family protein [Methylomirabilota bacterium]